MDLTIYTTADVGLLQMVLNGVAMFANQTTMIWGFALLICTWQLISTITQSGLSSVTSSGSAAMGKGVLSIGVALVLAMMLTTSKGPVKIQSLVTGTLTQVDNVPTLVVAAPATVSVLFKNVGQVMRQAFQSASADYDSVSAASNGFVNPLKSLLNLRSTVQRIGGIDTQVQTLVSACIANNPNVNFSSLNAKVLNAGNSGATSAESIPVTIDGSSAPTSIGALLMQARENTNQFVTDFNSATATIMSCSDAADFVALNIQAALASAEFSRAAQGAVNGSDTPNSSIDSSFTGQAQRYATLRKFNSTTSTLNGGLEQANAELVNLMFADLVKSELNCLKASSDNLAVCRAQMVQTSEIERNNLQNAAQADSSIKYLGQFATYLFALIIGLSPLIVMFMMAAGVGAYKSAILGVQMLVWPLLCLNAGAEVINAIMNWEFSNFMATLSNAGYISEASASELYKGLSLRIGTASSLMAGLPAIMAGIFALATNSAATHVGSNIAPKSTEAGSSAAPIASDTAPLMRTNAVATGSQMVGGSQVELNGQQALNTVGGTQLARTASAVASKTLTNQATISEGQSVLAEWAKGAHSSTNKGTDKVTGTSVSAAKEVDVTNSTSHETGTVKDASERKDNAKTTALSANAGAKVGISTPGGGSGGSGGAPIGASAEAGGSVQGTASATNSASAATTVSDAERRSQIQTARENLRRAKEESQHKKSGTSEVASIDKKLAALDRYESLLTSTQTQSNASEDAMRVSEEMKGFAQSINSQRIGFAAMNSDTFQRFQTTGGGASFANSAAAKPYVDQAMSEMKAGVISGYSATNPAGNRAVAQHYAASRMLSDGAASPEAKNQALLYLGDSIQALNGVTPSGLGGFSSPAPQGASFGPIAAPVNRTGVTPAQLQAATAKAGGGLAGTYRLPSTDGSAAPKPSVPRAKPVATTKSATPAVKAPEAPATGETDIEKRVYGGLSGADRKQEAVKGLLQDTHDKMNDGNTASRAGGMAYNTVKDTIGMDSVVGQTNLGKNTSNAKPAKPSSNPDDGVWENPM